MTTVASAAASQLVWFAALIPGFAALLLLDRRLARRGLLPLLALAFTLSLALLLPLTALAFLVHASVRACAWGYVLLVVTAFIVAARNGGAAALRSSWRATPRLPLFVALALAVLAAPFGTALAGDSPVHVAKVRWLLDAGCTLQDAYSPAAVIESRYTVNVDHLLLAVGAWLTRRDPVEWWFASAWFVRLLAIGAVELVGSALLVSRRAGAIAALGGFATIATMRSITLPNEICVLVPLPTLMFFTLAVVKHGRRRDLIGAIAAAVAIVAVHVGMWAVIGLCLLPAAAAVAFLRRRARWFQNVFVLGAAYLAVGAPLAWLTASQPSRAEEQTGAATAWLLRTIHFGSSLRFTILDPKQTTTMALSGVAILLLLLLRRARRDGERFAAAFWLSAAACMWFPPFFALLTRFMPHWIVMRCASTMFPFDCALVIGVPLWWLLRRFRGDRARLVLMLCAVAAGATLRREELGRLWRGRGAHVEAERLTAAASELLSARPEPRPLVAADAATSLFLPAAAHCSVLAPPILHGNPADVELAARARARDELFDATTTPDRRRELLRLLNVDYLLFTDWRVASEDQLDRAPHADLAAATVFSESCDRVAANEGCVLLKPRR